MTTKPVTKLTLKKETVRKLSAGDLRKAVGGARAVFSVACASYTFSAICPR